MLKLGIVGLGRWGRTLVHAIQMDGRAKGEVVRFSAAYTNSPARHLEFAKLENLSLFDSYEALLQPGVVDAVVIASPHSEHVAQICRAAEAGLHVFVEKPLALDVEGAAAAISAVRSARKKLAVGFNRRFLPAYRALRTCLQSGRLGQILHIEGNFSGPFGTHFRPEAWHASRSETPAGGMTLMGVHVLDSMIGCTGAISCVRARSRRQFLEIEMDDTTDVQMEFASGCTGYLSTLTATARNWRLQAFGTKGWVEMRGYQQIAIAIDGKEIETVRYPPLDIEQAELESFGRYIRDLEDYPVPIDDVLSGIHALDAIFASAKEDRPVRIEAR